MILSYILVGILLWFVHVTGTGCTTSTLTRTSDLDIVFVFDATGSMGSYINAAKDTIVNVVQDLDQADANVQMAVVAYRDTGDTPQFQIQDFLTSAQTADLQAFINGVNASGGGDTPENVLGGMYNAARSDAGGLAWRTTSNKVAILIADQPGHGSAADDWAWDGHTMSSVIPLYTAKGIQLQFVKILPSTDAFMSSMQDEFRSLLGDMDYTITTSLLSSSDIDGASFQQTIVENTVNCIAPAPDSFKYAAHPFPDEGIDCAAGKYRPVGVDHTDATAMAYACTVDNHCAGIYEPVCSGVNPDIWLCRTDFQQYDPSGECEGSCIFYNIRYLSMMPPFPPMAVMNRECCDVLDGSTSQCASTGDPHIITYDSPELYIHFQDQGDYTYFKNDYVEVQVRQEQPQCLSAVSTNSAIAIKLGRCNGGPQVLQFYAIWHDIVSTVNTIREAADMGFSTSSTYLLNGVEIAPSDIGAIIATSGCIDFCMFDYDVSNPNVFTMRFSGGSTIHVTGLTEGSGCNRYNMNVFIDMTSAMRSLNEDGICAEPVTSDAAANIGIAQTHKVLCSNRLLQFYEPSSGFCSRRRLDTEPNTSITIQRRRVSGNHWQNVVDAGISVGPLIRGCETNNWSRANDLVVEYSEVVQYFKDVCSACSCGAEVDLGCVYDYCATVPQDSANISLGLGESAREGCEYVENQREIYDAAPVPTPPPVPAEFVDQTTVEIITINYPSVSDCENHKNAISLSKEDRIIGCENRDGGSVWMSCETPGEFTLDFYSAPNCNLGFGYKFEAATINRSSGRCTETVTGGGEKMSWSGTCEGCFDDPAWAPFCSFYCGFPNAGSVCKSTCELCDDTSPTRHSGRRVENKLY